MGRKTPPGSLTGLLSPTEPSGLPSGQVAPLSASGSFRAIPVEIPVWGVDPASRHVSIAWMAPHNNVGVSSLTITEPSGGERLEALYEAVRRFALDLIIADKSRTPALVLVEQPFAYGHHVEPALFYSCGVVQAALSSAVAVFHSHPVVEDIPVPSWKAEAGIGGGARKEQVMAWARQHGYEGNVQDEADALAIALAAQGRCRRAAA